MTATHNIKADVKLVGGPRRATLELRGTVLVYHQRGWAGSASVYIPIEWISLSSRRRYDGSYLLGFFLSTLIFVSLLSALVVEVSGNGSSSPWILLGLGLPTAGCFAFATYQLHKFLHRKRTTLLTVDSDAGSMRIEFWHWPTRDRNLDDLINHLTFLRTRIGDMTAYPIQSSHTWYRLRPFRAVVLKGLLFSLVLYIPVSLIAGYLKMPQLMLFLLLPPAFYGAQYGFGSLRNLGSPKSFRAAVKSYNRGEVRRADFLLRDALAAYPNHAESLMLSVYVSVEQQKFDRAFDQCRKLAAVDREHADDLVKEVWAIKRMHERMELET